MREVSLDQQPEGQTLGGEYHIAHDLIEARGSWEGIDLLVTIGSVHVL